MKILVIGNGGREHVLCWKLRQSPNVEKVFCAPGNAGIANEAECVNIGVSEQDKLVKFATDNKIDFTVVGPEAPLCDGIVNQFQANGLKIFGPDKRAAQLEGSKSFAKDFMLKYDIPTAAAGAFDNADAAIDFTAGQFAGGAAGIVIKADGLAAGKGVLVTESKTSAVDFIRACFDGGFGSAGNRVLIEECLYGEEVSILALTDGKTILPLATSQDHKRAYDGDAGPNTGGMGAYSPAPVVTAPIMATIKAKILDNFLRGIQQEKFNFRGLIFVGVMVTAAGPKVLEFNVRFGDPEVQAVLRRLDSDLLDAMLKTVDGRLNEAKLLWSDDPAVCVVMASGGYPENYSKGYEITGLEEAAATGAIVFHAGTALNGNKIVNNGGRVLGVTARGQTVSAAIASAYQAVDKIHWQECFSRRDIGYRAIAREK
jgi:phosphoribosylamine--glycine ligase